MKNAFGAGLLARFGGKAKPVTGPTYVPASNTENTVVVTELPRGSAKKKKGKKKVKKVIVDNGVDP